MMIISTDGTGVTLGYGSIKTDINNGNDEGRMLVYRNIDNTWTKIYEKDGSTSVTGGDGLA